MRSKFLFIIPVCFLRRRYGIRRNRKGEKKRVVDKGMNEQVKKQFINSNFQVNSRFFFFFSLVFVT